MGLVRIQTDNAPAAIGPYSQAIRAGDYLFCSGQIPLLPETGEVVAGGIETQTRQVMENLSAVLIAAGVDCGSIAKTTIYLADLGDFAVVNDIYAKYCADPAPARATVQVAALPRGVLV